MSGLLEALRDRRAHPAEPEDRDPGHMITQPPSTGRLTPRAGIRPVLRKAPEQQYGAVIVHPLMQAVQDFRVADELERGESDHQLAVSLRESLGQVASEPSRPTHNQRRPVGHVSSLLFMRAACRGQTTSRI